MAGVAQLKAVVGMDNSKYIAGTKGVDKANKGMKVSFSNVAKGLAAAFSVRAVISFSKSVIDLGSKLSDMATQTGMNVETLQAFEYAAINAGASVEDVRTASVKLSVAMGKANDGQKTYIDLFKRIGVEQGKLAGLNTEQALVEVAKALGRASQGSSEFGAALELIGTRSGVKLVEVLRDLNDKGLAEFIQQAKDAGVVIDEELIGKLDKAADKMAIFSRISKGWLAKTASDTVTGAGIVAEGIGNVARLAGRFWSGRGGNVLEERRAAKEEPEADAQRKDENRRKISEITDRRSIVADEKIKKEEAAAAKILEYRKKAVEEAVKESKLRQDSDLAHLQFLESEEEADAKHAADIDDVLADMMKRKKEAGKYITPLGANLSSQEQLGASFGNERIQMQQYDKTLQLQQQLVDIQQDTRDKIDELIAGVTAMRGDV